jgi:hypothetical protein
VSGQIDRFAERNPDATDGFLIFNHPDEIADVVEAISQMRRCTFLFLGDSFRLSLRKGEGRVRVLRRGHSSAV